MDYKITLYRTDSDSTCRYVLGTNGLKPLFVIGLNPSTANDRIPDPTIRKVMGFAERNGFDSFVMLNLYPQRTPRPDRLDLLPDEMKLSRNREEILNVLNDSPYPVLLAAWGSSIDRRKYLRDCIREVMDITNELKVQWLKIGEPTKMGHPRHPLYAPYKLALTDFKPLAYLEN